MIFTISMANWLVDRFASRLNGGRLAIHNSVAPVVGQPPLVELAFKANAFQPADGTVADAFPLEPAIVMQSGHAQSAALLMANGDLVATVPIKLVDAPDAEIGDVLVTQTELQRGGLCQVSRITLSIPLRTR